MFLLLITQSISFSGGVFMGAWLRKRGREGETDMDRETVLHGLLFL